VSAPVPPSVPAVGPGTEIGVAQTGQG
jgi:hypothetical protein